MERITVTRPDGGHCTAYEETSPNHTSAPGLVVLQEWWGVNDQIKSVAAQYAAQGYRVVVPDLYRGQMGLDAKEAEHLMSNLNFADAASQDVRGAVQYLKATGAPRVGVIGYCMGGALTLLATVFVPEVDAAVVWYGFPPLEFIDATKIAVPILAHFATDDAFFPIAGVDALEAKLASAHVTFECHRYHAQHAFANETHVDRPLPMKYDATAAATAWSRTLPFLHRHLRAGR